MRTKSLMSREETDDKIFASAPINEMYHIQINKHIRKLLRHNSTNFQLFKWCDCNGNITSDPWNDRDLKKTTTKHSLSLLTTF